ncbi:pyridoxamine 5'-phosphate oxidase family protein [Amycolatopsis granulosa]|uniref:pyridoxamine 5'-phosphate oxidase family protein n=1 Tax=Amycolatopsis granulosa TaxID=185684 RepID=UPI001421DF9B|nr:pyridoxamine 5'-phosphate oxidase family protein [Amycolatopsis granulosa]NIH84705.1 PPOX class probable F420-dependent enzyme [Amycolatopsis granulosa]
MTNLDAARSLAAQETGLATVAVARPDGTVHASVVNAGFLDDPVSGRPAVAFVTPGGTKKLELLRARGTATVLFRRGWSWAAVQGPARLLGPDDADPDFDPAGLPKLLRDIFTAAGGTHDDWDTYDRVMARERRCAVLVEAKRITGSA